ncbi:MAG: cysteine hydrolase family protein [Chloroflexota bacterium]
MTTALLIIDAQNDMFAPTPVYESERVLQTLQDLINRARTANAPIILARNDGGPGSPDERGTSGWDLHPALDPDQADLIVDKDTEDAFLRTGLASWLIQSGISKLVICGMQTEYCVDTTCRAAYALGYSVTLVADAHSTYDSEISVRPKSLPITTPS